MSSQRNTRLLGTLCVVIVAVGLVACGYRIAGRTSPLPSNWKVLAVPAFENRTMQFRIEQKLTAAVIREFISRTRYRVVTDEEGADGVLHGEVVRLSTSPIVFDPSTGKASTVIITISAKVTLTDRHTKQILYRGDNLVFRESYEVTSDLHSFFQEQDPAFDRLAREFAVTLVSTVLENF